MFEVGASCVFLCDSVQLGAVFCFTSVSVYKISHSKCEIHAVLSLFPNISIMLEGICIFKVSVIAELSVTILKYLSGASW